MQNIGRNQSEKARREIQQCFGLVKAEDSKKRKHYELKPVAIQKVQYGHSQTKRAITNVLDAVLQTYKYTSLPELNAVLRQYNITADAGSENSRLRQYQGLLYRILDENGNYVGVPIKASDFYSKPTLKYLEERFQSNEVGRQPYKSRVKNVIDLTLLKQPNSSFSNLMKTLEKEGIVTVPRTNVSGVVYGITYVDHQTKCVFNGSALGKPYSANGIQQRCLSEELLTSPQITQPSEKIQISQLDSELQDKSDIQKSGKNQVITNDKAANSQSASMGVMETLLKPDQNADYVPSQLKNSSKKKKKKQHNNQL